MRNSLARLIQHMAAQLSAEASWSRSVVPAADLRDFLFNWSGGDHDDPQTETTSADALEYFDGWLNRHPLLVGPQNYPLAAAASGEIRDGRGYHPAATFSYPEPYWARR